MATYTVRSGDSWDRLKAMFGSSIQSANPAIKTLKTGMVLTIPSAKATTTQIPNGITQPTNKQPLSRNGLPLVDYARQQMRNLGFNVSRDWRQSQQARQAAGQASYPTRPNTPGGRGNAGYSTYMADRNAYYQNGSGGGSSGAGYAPGTSVRPNANSASQWKAQPQASRPAYFGGGDRPAGPVKNFTGVAGGRGDAGYSDYLEKRETYYEWVMALAEPETSSPTSSSGSDSGWGYGYTPRSYGGYGNYSIPGNTSFALDPVYWRI